MKLTGQLIEAGQLNDLLLKAFPELRGIFDEYTSWRDGVDTGCFLAYEDLLLSLARRALEAKDEEVLGRVNAFIDDLLRLDDDYAGNLTTVALLEGLKDCRSDTAVRARPGERTLPAYDASRG